jgi:hypothetical protein
MSSGLGLLRYYEAAITAANLSFAWQAFELNNVRDGCFRVR